MGLATGCVRAVCAIAPSARDLFAGLPEQAGMFEIGAVRKSRLRLVASEGVRRNGAVWRSVRASPNFQAVWIAEQDINRLRIFAVSGRTP